MLRSDNIDELSATVSSSRYSLLGVRSFIMPNSSSCRYWRIKYSLEHETVLASWLRPLIHTDSIHLSALPKLHDSRRPRVLVLVKKW